MLRPDNKQQLWDSPEKRNNYYNSITVFFFHFSITRRTSIAIYSITGQDKRGRIGKGNSITDN